MCLLYQSRTKKKRKPCRFWKWLRSDFYVPFVILTKPFEIAEFYHIAVPNDKFSPFAVDYPVLVFRGSAAAATLYALST